MTAAPTITAPDTGAEILDTLLDEVVLDLLSGPTRPAPSAALAAAGRAVAGTRWGSYRAGRARLSSMAAIYLSWLAPPQDWTLTGTIDVGRTVLLWTGPAGERIADLCVACTPGEKVLDSRTRAVVDAGLEAVDADGVDGVRVLALGAPTSSLLVTAQGASTLRDSDLWFEGA